MKNHKISGKFSLFLLLLFVCNKLGYANELELEIRTAKKEFSLNEELEVFPQITYTASDFESIILPALFIPEFYYIKFIIQNSKGEQVKFIGPEFDYRESHSDLYTMYDGWFVGRRINLFEYYDLKPGNYNIYAIYEIQDYQRKENNVWLGKLVSNTINIVITEKETEGLNNSSSSPNPNVTK